MDGINQTSQTQQQVSPTPASINNSSGSKLIPIILGVAAVAIIAIGAYVLGSKQSQPVVQNPQNSMVPTVIPTLTSDTSDVSSMKAFASERFGVSFQYPTNWNYYTNDTPIEQLNLPDNTILSSQYEIVTDNKGCAFCIAKGGGGHGPSNILTNEPVAIDGKMFTKRSWYRKEGGTPIFNYYFGDENLQYKFDTIWTWIPEEDPITCQKNIDQILSTFQFIE